MYVELPLLVVGLVHLQLEIRSVEHGICPIAVSTMNELFL